jgi:glutamate racemase
MRIALLNSGLGLLAAAAWLHRLRPDADLVLSMDPDGMPWGSRTPADIAQRSLSCARAAAAYQPDVLVFACNTGSVHALGALRAEFEPRIPVVGTVPAIKPAAAASDAIAIWATAATTGSAYQRELISEFAASVQVAEVACRGLADAIHAGDEAAAGAAVRDAAARTPAGCGAIVLGCTEYELAADLIGRALPGVVLFGSAAAVAAQALRRVAAAGDAGNSGAAANAGTAASQSTMDDAPASGDCSNADDVTTADSSGAVRDAATPGNSGTGRNPAAQDNASATHHASMGTLRVLLSGRPSGLPRAALRYPEGRLLAGLPAAPPPPVDPAEGNPAASSPVPILT